MDMLDIKSAQAGVLLKGLIDKGELIRVSRGKTTRYVKYREHLNLSPYSQKEKVLKLINDKKIVTNKDVQTILEITSRNTNVLLSCMVKKGEIKRISRGKYALNA